MLRRRDRRHCAASNGTLVAPASATTTARTAATATGEATSATATTTAVTTTATSTTTSAALTTSTATASTSPSALLLAESVRCQPSCRDSTTTCDVSGVAPSLPLLVLPTHTNTHTRPPLCTTRPPTRRSSGAVDLPVLQAYGPITSPNGPNRASEMKRTKMNSPNSPNPPLLMMAWV